MNINRDNYEEYFIMFADNELSHHEKYEVEAFVKDHPDLEAELLLIKQSIFVPDNTVSLDDKSFLFKEDNHHISHDNFQQFFVLYYDNELTDEQRNETMLFLTNNPSLKKEFDLFKKIKYQADKKTGFPNKKILYKKEGDVKVVPMWWKALAAAILAGLGIWIGADYLLHSKKENPLVINNSTLNKIKTIKPVLMDTASPVNEKDQAVTTNQISSSPLKSIVKDDKIKNKKPVNNFSNIQLKENASPSNSVAVKNKNQSKLKIIPEEVDAPGEKESSIAENNQEHSQDDMALIEKNIDADKSARKLVQQTDIDITDKISTPDVVTTSYVEDENSDNYTFYNMPRERFNKTKIGGFLHKVKRVIERKFFNTLKNDQEVARN